MGAIGRAAFVLSFVAIALSVVVLGLAVRANGTDHAALCKFRGDLETRYESGVSWFKKHPAGAPALGLSAGYIRRSLAGEKATLNSLNSLNC